MLSLKEFLKEDVNVHMEHLCDLPFNEGVDGARKAILFLISLRNMLAGSSTSKMSATVKWDGAPAVFAGVDPRDGKFFIAKKGIFNVNPKVYKTPEEIAADTQGDLAYKLTVALEEFKKLGIKSGVYQGDLMFTHDTLKMETIDGQSYVTFHPNTIVYAVPTGTPEAHRILGAKIGVVWHTTYHGSSFETMKASFGKPIVDGLNHVKSVWMMDATYHDYSGVATFTKQETDELTNILSHAGKVFNTISGRALDAIKSDADFLLMVKTFNNSKIRSGEGITNTQAHVQGLFHYIYDKFEKEIASKKTEKAKETQKAKRDRILNFFRIYTAEELVKIYDLINLIALAKHMIINKMNQASSIATFVRTHNGFKTTAPEGYVAIDHMAGGAVKLVNRMEFSRANFSPEILKGWQR